MRMFKGTSAILAALLIAASVAWAQAPGPAAKELTVTMKVFALDKRAADPVRQGQLVVELTDAAPPDRPLRELDPFGATWRIEYEASINGRDCGLHYCLDRLWDRRYQLEYAGQVIYPFKADDDQAALDEALRWLQSEVAAQYSQAARQRPVSPGQ